MSDVDDFLAHYGVRGMKWGIRKKESPTPIKQRKPLTKKQKTLIVAGTAVGIGVVAAGIILGRPKLLAHLEVKRSADLLLSDLKNNEGTSSVIRKGEQYYINHVTKDVTIPAGVKFHRVASALETDIKNSPKYANYLREDVAKYRATFNPAFRKEGTQKFKTTFEALTDTKIAGQESMARAANDIVSASSKTSGRMRSELISVYKNQADFEFIRDKYARASDSEVIDRWLDLKSGGSWTSDVSKKFLSELRDQGYAGLTDQADSAGLSKHAVVLINDSLLKTVGGKMTSADVKAAEKILDKLGTIY